MIKKYLTFTVKAFQRTLTYRFELWMELFINVLFMLVYVYLWKALYTGRTSVEGYDLNKILTYIVVSQTLLTFTFTLRVARIIEEKVRTGEVVTDLMKPVDFQLMILTTAAGTSSHTVLFNMLPKFLLFYGAFGLSLPSSLLTVSPLYHQRGFRVCHPVQYRIYNRYLRLLACRDPWSLCLRYMGAGYVVFRLLFAFGILSRFLSQNCSGLAVSCHYLFPNCHLHRSINRRGSSHGTVDTIDLGGCVGGDWTVGIPGSLS